jgi:hypothetical protein
MEDVLAVYHRPYTERKPVICMDEQPVQLPGEKREPVPMNEHHGKRRGTCSVFMFVEPLGGRRYQKRFIQFFCFGKQLIHIPFPVTDGYHFYPLGNIRRTPFHRFQPPETLFFLYRPHLFTPMACRLILRFRPVIA